MSAWVQASAQLRETGVALLRGVFATDALAPLRLAVAQSFAAIEADDSLAERYRFSRAAHSLPVATLLNFGVEGEAGLLAPLGVPGLAGLFSEAAGAECACRLEQSWVRKKFAPHRAPQAGYFLQNWHQDGALGVRFPAQAGPVVPMTELLTCWIPLGACGVDSPGLQFVRRRQPALLHFTELTDAAIRERFPDEEFWGPELAVGDGVVFTNDVLHRTSVRPEMRRDRLSVEYRIFPG